jgi:hypothetical protein
MPVTWNSPSACGPSGSAFAPGPFAKVGVGTGSVSGFPTVVGRALDGGVGSARDCGIGNGRDSTFAVGVDSGGFSTTVVLTGEVGAPSSAFSPSPSAISVTELKITGSFFEFVAFRNWAIFQVAGTFAYAYPSASAISRSVIFSTDPANLRCTPEAGALEIDGLRRPARVGCRSIRAAPPC